MPHVWPLGSGGGGGSTPGSILSIYGGQLPLVDFTTNSTTYVSSGFPTNTSFNKVSGTSVLGIYGEADFTSSASQPDVLFFAVFIDGGNYEATGIQTAKANFFCTAVICTVKGVAGTIPTPLAAGPHTVDVRTACANGSNFTMRTSTSVDLTIVEFIA